MQRIGDSRGHLAGFHVSQPGPGVPELHDVGDEWLLARRPMDWHAHPGWEIYLQVSGSSVRSSASTVSELHAGDAYLSPPGARHRVVNRGTDQSHSRFVRFALEPVLRRQRQIRSQWDLSDCLLLRQARELDAPFVQMIREVSFQRPFRDEGLRLSLDALAIAVARLRSGVTETSMALVPEAVLEAQALLDGSCERPWSVRELSSRVRLSSSHLLALFRIHLGSSPHRYLLQARIARARGLLATSDAPITAIALETGFSSSQHFAKAFKAITGMTPREHRKCARI
jgi:AraC-like DNA-binding protein